VSLFQLSPVAQDYLKVIWNAMEWSSAPVTTKLLAERLGVAASTVSETVTRLAKQGLVVHEPYGAIDLTDAGRELAVAMVRRHRLIETLLVQELGYTWDEVHDEAEVLEHAVSDLLIDRIDARLGYPERDPHGDRIPTSSGNVNVKPAQQVSDMAIGTSGTVLRISDADPEMLRYFASIGLALDTVLTVTERRDYAGLVCVRADSGTDEIHLGDVAAQSIWVSVAD
jgi:DtxR family Mn-dependent transcriptional regulator